LHSLEHAAHERRNRWLGATLSAIALSCGAAQAAPAPTKAEAEARADLVRQSQLPNEPGVARQGSHAARQGVHPSQLPLRHADDRLPQRQRIGEPSAAPTNLSSAAKAARLVQAGPRGAKLAATAAGVTPVQCTGQDFVGKSGAALIAFIDGADLRGCMYTLYSGSVAQYRSVFSDANIITVANTLKARAVTYPGDDSGNAIVTRLQYVF
jgi:microbial collagenase